MITTFNRTSVALAVSAALSLVSGAAHAQIVINDTLTGKHSNFNWLALDGACLTAGDNSVTDYDSTQPAGYTPNPAAVTIPSCTNLAYYTNKGSTQVGGANGTMPDASGFGALRLTNGDKRQFGSNGDYETGAVISNFTFPMSQGVQVTWTSVTYGGDNQNGTGADGISFFLSDGSYTPVKAGGSGGSLGYSCSNGNPQYEGLLGGYIGIGIDEFGNFTNGATFDGNGNLTSTGDNTATGTGYHPGTIGIRGAGNITWAQLHAAYPDYYPSTATADQQRTAVRKTCATGHLYDAINGTANTSTATAIHDYPLLASSAFNGSIANQQATSSDTDNVPKRTAAVPITYSLRITSAGKLDFSYSINGGASTSVANGVDIVSTNGALPASLRFGFSAGTGGSNNIHEITCFKAAPADTSNSTAGSNVQSGKIQTTSQFFIAYYHPTNWWGQLTANALVFNGTTLTAATNATWDASCKLTGGTCSTMSGSPTITAQSSRVILSNSGATSSGGTGVALTTSGLSSTQLGYLGGSSSSAPVLDYLRGSRANEVGSGTGAYRIRSGLLGDIVDSSPVLVSYPNASYTGAFTDKLGTTANASMPEGSTYATFKASNYTRRNVVYVGSNDGMLHGFSAGKFNAPSGSNAPAFDTASTWNDGFEVLAYMPAQVVATIQPSSYCSASDTTCKTAASALEFSNPGYYHNFFVDSTPGTGDLYYGAGTKSWHTWVVGGLGVGGHVGGAIQDNTTVLAQPVSSFFVLDVTDPGAFTEANASSLVVGEWNSSTMTCNVGNVGSLNCGSYLGQTLGTPVIRRLHDGTWGVIFGNGTNSNGGGASGTPGRSGLFIMHVASNGSKTFQYIDANAGPNGGIVQVAAADLDGDHVTDYVYAGDVLGNLYRFDLTNTDASQWASMKIFTTAGSQQPITTMPFVTAVPGAGSGNPKIVVAFGTGQKLPATTNHGEVYATGQQNVYGIWDSNMTAWNSKSSDSKFAALTQSSSTTPVAIASNTIQEQTVTLDSAGNRLVSNLDMCWVGMTCTNAPSGTTLNAMGWKLTLPTSTEQIIFNPTVFNDDLFFNTTIPATSTVITCASDPVSGWTMGISLSNGGAGDTTAFVDGSSGHNTNGTGSPTQLSTDSNNGSKPFVCENTNNNHTVKCDEIHPLTGAGKRVTWTKVR